MEDRRLLTVGSVAHLVAEATKEPCSPDRIRRYVDEGRLPAQRTSSGIRLIRAEDAQRLAQRLAG